LASTSASGTTFELTLPLNYQMAAIAAHAAVISNSPLVQRND